MTGTALINGPNGIREQLIDSRKVTWSDLTLLEALNEAQRTISFWKADAFTKLENRELVEGINQTLAEDGLAVMNVTHNVYSGSRVTLVDLELLEETNRFWPVTGMDRDVEHFCADPRDPRRFKVTPPNDGTGEVRVLFGAIPTPLAAIGDTIALPDSYEYVLKLMTMAAAYRKNTQRQDLSKTTALTQEARVSLGIKSQSQVAVAPKVAVSEGKQ